MSILSWSVKRVAWEPNRQHSLSSRVFLRWCYRLFDHGDEFCEYLTVFPELLAFFANREHKGQFWIGIWLYSPAKNWRDKNRYWTRNDPNLNSLDVNSWLRLLGLDDVWMRLSCCTASVVFLPVVAVLLLRPHSHPCCPGHSAHLHALHRLPPSMDCTCSAPLHIRPYLMLFL